jgi:hypothetical protein
MKRDLTRIGLTLVFLSAMCASAAAQQPTLTDITTADELGARFDADRGKFRAVLLLSPT